MPGWGMNSPPLVGFRVLLLAAGSHNGTVVSRLPAVVRVCCTQTGEDIGGRRVVVIGVIHQINTLGHAVGAWITSTGTLRIAAGIHDSGHQGATLCRSTAASAAHQG